MGQESLPVCKEWRVEAGSRDERYSQARQQHASMEGASAAPMEQAEKANLTHLARGAEWRGYTKNITPKALQVNRDA
jgi:hypothetical protein